MPGNLILGKWKDFEQFKSFDLNLRAEKRVWYILKILKKQRNLNNYQAW